MTEILEENYRPRRTLIIVENVSAPLDQRLWSEATALQRAGYEVSVICPRRRSTELPEETIDGIRVFRHPMPFQASSFLGKLFELPIALFWEFVLAVRISRRYGFDVIHICNPPNIIFLTGAIFKIFARKSVVFDFRDANPGRGQGSRGSLTELLAFKTADVSLSINEPHRQIAIGRGRMPAKRAVVLRPCPDIEFIAPKKPDPLWRNRRAHLVAYAGEVSKEEGLDLLVSMIEYIVHDQKRTDIQFVIVGGGPELHEIAGLCGKLDLSDYVTFTGWADDAALTTILSSADICVDPRPVTTINSIMPRQKIMQYMAIGKPIVQFDTSEGHLLAHEASYYAQENDSVDFANQILKLIDHPGTRRTMGDLGQQRIRKGLSWQREQQKLLLSYDLVFAIRAQRSAPPKQQKERKAPKSQTVKHK